MDDLFQADASVKSHHLQSLKSEPLASRMRPRKIEELVGQSHLVSEGKLLNRMIADDRITSMILFGPPGSGKTTLAHIISHETRSRFVAINAVTSNVSEIRKVIQDAEALLRHKSLRTLLFIDEIHRFNKSQQDVLMPFIEKGVVTLIGATTHNPSFSLNAPLLSRCTVFELRGLLESDLVQLLQKAHSDSERGLGHLGCEIDRDALLFIAKQSLGDARKALNFLETATLMATSTRESEKRVTLGLATEACQKMMVRYDHDEDGHYDTISAFIKSMRGSDVDASIYWLSKMLYAGEDPRFIMRRIIIFASEDIGNADPQSLILAASAMQGIEFVGMPESRIILSQIVIYCALAPKSNSAYMAISKALSDVEGGKNLNVPLHLRNAHYPGEKKADADQYQYPHSQRKIDQEFPQPAGQKYLPESLRYYLPTSSGFEKTLLDRLASLRRS